MIPLFTDAFDHLTPDEREAYHRTVFLQMDTPQAAALRLEYYRGLLRHVGDNVGIGCGVKFINPQYISLGDGVSIDDHCALLARSERGITLGEKTRLKYGVYLDTETANGYIKTGERVYLGTGCCLHGHLGLEIGDDTLLAQNVTLTPYSHRFDDPARPIIQQGGHTRRVVIGRDCYLGMGVCVLWSADIGDGSVVGAGSVVVDPVPPFSVAVGVPARVIRRRGEPISGLNRSL
jgi:acetyltransferase-like isoleucine patch superfamily enzyme